MNNTPKTHLRRAINLLGGLTASSKAVNVKSHSVVNGWLITRVPAQYCPLIENATQGVVTCEQLRPDIRWDVVRSGHLTCSQAADDVPNAGKMMQNAAAHSAE
jgi:DNA-binding transcriptional regulator YdaS (Cro superfamily)